MALWHSRVKIRSRVVKDPGTKKVVKENRSIVAAAAYRAGVRLKDEKYGVTHDYRGKQKGVAHAEIMAPENAPGWMLNREKLWNGVEKREDESSRRKDAQLARDLELALPVELSDAENLALVRQWAKRELVDRGMVVDFAIHEPKPKGEQRNPHVHLLFTMREIAGDGFGNKVREWNGDWRGKANNTGFYEGMLARWEQDVNDALAAAGSEARVDRRSFEERGIDRTPSVHMGVEATQMQQRGQRSERGDLQRRIAAKNALHDHETAMAASDGTPADSPAWKAKDAAADRKTGGRRAQDQALRDINRQVRTEATLGTAALSEGYSNKEYFERLEQLRLRELLQREAKNQARDGKASTWQEQVAARRQEQVKELEPER